MKSRIKCNNETVAVLLLTGSLLLVTMNNYAYEGARNDATTALQTQNTVSDKHSAVDEATPETLLTYAKMLEAQITSAYAISSVPMLASGRNNTVKSSEDQDNVVLYGNNNAIEFSRSSTVFGNGIKANNTPNSVMMGNGIEIQGIAANGTAYDPVTGQVGPDPDRGIGNVAVGQNILVGKQLTSATAVASAGTVALGADVHLIGNYSIGIGQQSEVIGQGSIGIGHNSQIGSDNQTGYSSLTDSTAIGTGSVIQEGDATHGLGIQGGYSTAIGANTHIQGARNEALGVKSTVIGNDSTAIGYQSGIYYGQESMAVGNYATISNKEADATTSGAMAAGVRASVGEDADYSAAVGYKATVGNNAKESVAMGYNTNITKSASNATALGSFAGVSATYGTAVGYNAHAAKQGTALGGSSTAAANSTALGISSAAAAENSVALGAWSKAETTDLLSKYMPKFAWDATNDINGVVSIGQTGMTRRLINVSNGRIAADSTDAVNGSQLYYVWKDLYDQIINPNADPNGSSAAGNSTSNTDPDIPVVKPANPVNPDTGNTDQAKSDFQLINGKEQIIDKEGNTMAVATAEGDIKTGYKADANGNIDLQVQDKENGTTRHVVLTDVASAQKLNEVETQVDQNTQSISILNQSVTDLDSRIDRVGASAAALAALHPLDFDPDAKWDFAAGYGNYKGADAVAVGTYYRPNEDTMFSVGGSFGGGENMVNAGISVKLGSGSNHVSTSRVAMAKEIKDMRKEMEAMKATMLDVHTGKKFDASRLQLFPDIPKNHWAYEYVAVLAGNGMIKGYPDGTFSGDRPMTRYEFAAMLYRAMRNGATLSDKLLAEFEPELERFTVDTIHKDKNGNPAVERVRVKK